MAVTQQIDLTGAVGRMVASVLLGLADENRRSAASIRLAVRLLRRKNSVLDNGGLVARRFEVP